MSVLLSQFSKQLENTFRLNENLELLSGLPDSYREAIFSTVKYGSALKGDDLKAFLNDVKGGLDPERYINNDFTVENEAIELVSRLTRETTRAKQLSFFADAYLEKLKDRAARAQLRAEVVREERARREREEAESAGAIPFPQAN